ncbi:hypothetical protein PILCRDRAFT_4935 [Piloderma croceum F 1598]|uniref:Uncharacterized protein n=1 Tax=Piloderma croceum (strain F 1598) TaxID=765440 RepID=A0A0C3C9Q6_PILCF|nr:hypothetical protein PILCRDRAFT_4935 [Piloderma croceum F 1598]
MTAPCRDEHSNDQPMSTPTPTGTRLGTESRLFLGKLEIRGGGMRRSKNHRLLRTLRHIGLCTSNRRAVLTIARAIEVFNGYRRHKLFGDVNSAKTSRGERFSKFIGRVQCSSTAIGTACSTNVKQKVEVTFRSDDTNVSYANAFLTIDVINIV